METDGNITGVEIGYAQKLPTPDLRAMAEYAQAIARKSEVLSTYLRRVAIKELERRINNDDPQAEPIESVIEDFSALQLGDAALADLLQASRVLYEASLDESPELLAFVSRFDRAITAYSAHRLRER